MMTFKELKEKVQVADKTNRTPGAVLLQADGVIVAKEVINTDTEITVFNNGYVLYKAGRHMTVFPLHECKEYDYRSVVQESNVVEETLFDHTKWYVRLVLEGEDRLSSNLEKSQQKHCVSYTCVSEEWSVLLDKSADVEKEVTDREYIRELFEQVGDRAAYAIKKYYLENELQEEIAKDLSIKAGAVSKLIRTNIIKIREVSEKSEKENYKKKLKK